ncbi:MAG TPA: alpha/beta hydrolase [Geminicoccus sp.]|uniref:alpha/beta hydrolase n=1 Tax=Geminicoccus sp. TaxID=2024832 RepID=UPI002C567DCC|nr:alpha/beta hydrolase [Geminicoccus sp.]HWL70758.1 alpha/beta hydrolase [Geminicoccus sp.]
MSLQRETRVDWPTVAGLRLRCVTWRSDGERRGTVVICNGRTEFVEKYLGVVAELQARRFDIVAFDWRGQGLSDRLLPDRSKGHVESFDDYLDDLRAIMALVDRLALPSPRVMLAHSTGGQVGLRFLHDHPGAFAGAAMSAPMLGMRFAGIPTAVAVGLVRAMCAGGRSRDYAFGQGAKPYVYHAFPENVLTSCEESYLAYRALVDADPELGLGGPTFAWVRAALRSITISRQPAFLEQIGCPVLLALGDEERVVDPRAIMRAAALLPRAELLQIAGARHEILIERPALRQAFWTRFDMWFSRLQPS